MATHYTNMPELSTIIARSYLAADATYNNDDTLGDTALSVVVASSTKYKIEFVGFSTSVNRNLKLDFGGTATITNFIGDWYAYDSANATVCEALRVAAAGTDFDAAGNLDSGVDGCFMFRGSVEVNVGGTFLVRAAQRTADAGNTVLKRGSTLQLTKMS